MSSNHNPVVRRKNMVVQELKHEVLVYDLELNKAYCLNETVAAVYGLCDGRNSVSEISKKLGQKFNSPVADEFVFLAINELSRNNLLESSHVSNTSRRHLIKRAGLATMLALPVITMLSAPKAAHAQSGCTPNGGACVFSDNTQGTCCNGLRCIGSCTPCSLTGFTFGFCPNGTLEQCTFFCSTLPSKNLCCNSGDSGLVAVTGGFNCVCP